MYLFSDWLYSARDNCSGRHYALNFWSFQERFLRLFPLRSYTYRSWHGRNWYLHFLYSIHKISCKIFDGTEEKDFYILSVIVAVSCLQRYIGVAMVPTALAAVLLLVKIPLSERIKYSIKFLIISLTPLFFWLLRNYMLTSTMSGPRTASSYSFQHNIAKTFDVITAWFIPSFMSLNIRLIFAGILFFILISIGIITYFKKNSSKVNIILIQAVYFLIYTIFIIILSSFSSLDPTLTDI